METFSFSGAIAKILEAELEDTAPGVPVYPERAAAHDVCERVEVQTEEVEEIIPGNGTARLSGTIRFYSEAAREAAEAAEEVTSCIYTALTSHVTAKRELDDLGCPATVLHDMRLTAGATEQDGPFYVHSITFYTILQF